MNRKRKVFGPVLLIGLIFFLIGVGQLTVGIATAVAGHKTMEGMDKITGVVSEVTSNDVYVEYRYMSRDYEDRLSFYSSLLTPGEEIELYINPEYPEQANAKTGIMLISVIFSSIGALFAVIGGAFLIWGCTGKNKAKRLMVSGRKLYAEVTGGRICYNYRVNGRHPFKLDCKYEDGFTGETFLYSSELTWEDPELYIGRQVAVYVDPQDMSKYYVDLDSLQGGDTVVHDFR